MAFNDIQLKVVAESAVEAAKAEIAPLTLFAHSYNSEIVNLVPLLQFQHLTLKLLSLVLTVTWVKMSSVVN